MKYELLKAIYGCFNTPPEFAAEKREVEDCHRALIERLDKQERRLVLRIMDEKDRIGEETSIDSFFFGFELAWQLSIELNHYKSERPVSCKRQRDRTLGSCLARKKKPKEVRLRSCDCSLPGLVRRCVSANRNGQGNTHGCRNTHCDRHRADCRALGLRCFPRQARGPVLY